MIKTYHKIVTGDSRQMSEVKDSSVHLAITSPPYWQLKDYGSEQQIGFYEDYETYVNLLNLVWKECHRVLHPGGIHLANPILPIIGRATTFAGRKDCELIFPHADAGSSLQT